ncbi:MAG: TRAP transporter large permease [Aquisalimonadaceae bacterium]
MSWVLFGLPLLLLALGFPVFIALLAAAAVTLTFFMNVPGVAVHRALFGSMDTYALLAVPFYLFAGELMARGSMSRRLVDWAMSLMGGMRGGLGLVTLSGSTFFGAISGSSVATVAAIGRLVQAPLEAQGYDQRFGPALVAASAAVALLIPPSIALILYGIAAQQSITRLFAAGILPGLLMSVVLGVYIYIMARVKGLKAVRPFEGRAFVRASGQSSLALGMPIIILGGIYFGVFSPTEAAGVACVYALVVSCGIYRDVSLRAAWDTAVQSMYLTSQILIIVAAAGVFSWVMTTNGVPRMLAGGIANLDITTWQLLIVINLLLLVVGCFIDTPSAILLLTPLLLPIVQAVGVDPIHFGIIMTMNLSIGLFTPPFGLNLFVTQALMRPRPSDLYLGVMPFVAVSVLALLIVTFIPSISLALLPYLY